MRWLGRRPADKGRDQHNEPADGDAGGSSVGVIEWSFTELIARHELKALNAILVLYLLSGTVLFYALAPAGPGARNSSSSSAPSREPSIREKALRELRMESVRRMWNITNRLNILYESNWSALVLDELVEFERRLAESSAADGRRCDDADENDIEIDAGDGDGADDDDRDTKRKGDGKRQQQRQRNALADRIRSVRRAFLHSLATITTIGKWFTFIGDRAAER